MGDDAVVVGALHLLTDCSGGSIRVRVGVMLIIQLKLKLKLKLRSRLKIMLGSS